jgi:DNA polymerase I-like protein with 3'-5' exonuclease and polymerase domains
MVNVQYVIDTEFQEGRVSDLDRNKAVGSPGGVQQRHERVRLAHMIHDELLYEAREEDALAVSEQQRQVIEGAVCRPIHNEGVGLG